MCYLFHASKQTLTLIVGVNRYEQSIDSGCKLMEHFIVDFAYC